MPALTLASVETCITAAFQSYATSTTGTITVATPDNGNVDVTCVIVGSQFNTGFPGYTLPAAQSDNLRQWCITHPGNGWSYGFRGTDPTHPDSVNVTLINYTPKMFNFHVYLS
jgi:hypothetical protein